MWYIFQITIFSTIVYKYVTEIAPEQLLGHIMLFAGIVTFVVTWMISKLLDVIYRLIRLIRSTPVRSLAVTGSRKLPRFRRSHKKLH